MSRHRQPHTALRRGFTLLELVIVLMILAALAGLVIAQVAQLGRTTDMAYTAKTGADLAENLQLHFVLNKRYPTHMDSLLIDADNSGALGTTPGGDGLTSDGVFVPAFWDGGAWVDPPTSVQGRGLPDSGPHLDRALVAANVTEGAFRSFVRCGFEFLMDHRGDGTDNNGNSNETGALVRDLGVSDGDSTGLETGHLFAVVDPTPTNGDAQRLLRQIFPATLDPATGFYSIPSDYDALIAVGIGPRNSAVPDSMLNAPIYPGNDGSYYGHYVAIFACYASGERAILVGVCDAYGRLNRYAIEQFNESLPNNQRRG